MQLSKQCTWISLNLTRISNQARRWVEGVFSRSKYVSSNQMCMSQPPKAGHFLFISPLKETIRWLLSLGWKREHRTLPSDHRTLEPQRPVLRGWPRVLHEIRVSVSNGYLQNTGRSIGPHRTHAQGVPQTWSPDVSHRTHPEGPVLTGLKHRKGCKTPSHRTLTIGRS